MSFTRQDIEEIFKEDENGQFHVWLATGKYLVLTKPSCGDRYLRSPDGIYIAYSGIVSIQLVKRAVFGGHVRGQDDEIPHPRRDPRSRLN